MHPFDARPDFVGLQQRAGQKRQVPLAPALGDLEVAFGIGEQLLPYDQAFADHIAHDGRCAGLCPQCAQIGVHVLLWLQARGQQIAGRYRPGGAAVDRAGGGWAVRGRLRCLESADRAALGEWRCAGGLRQARIQNQGRCLQAPAQYADR